MGSTDYKPLKIDYWSNLTTMIWDMVELENSNFCAIKIFDQHLERNGSMI